MSNTNKEFIVLKLGGTSQCKKAYDKLITYISELTNQNKFVFIVLSAVSGVTNLLEKYTKTKDYTYISDALDLNEKLLNELFPSDEFSSNEITSYLISDFESRLNDLTNSYVDLDNIVVKSRIIGFGELMSTCIFNKYYENSLLLDSYNYIRTKKEVYDLFPSVEFYCADTIFNLPTDKFNTFVLQGFIGSDNLMNPTLLGRGGSDTTGSIIAAKLHAIRYEVWTDVEGIYTSDPRINPNVEIIKNISYEICKEIAALGAKVMHPLSILPCELKLIPIIVKSSFTNGDGTLISTTNDDKKIIAIQKNVTLFNIKSENMWCAYGFVSDIFRRFSENHIDINIITTSQFEITTTTNEKNKYLLNKVKQDLSENYDVQINSDCTIISIISMNIYNQINRLELNKIKPDIIHIGSNNLSVNLVFKKILNMNELFNKLNF